MDTTEIAAGILQELGDWDIEVVADSRQAFATLARTDVDLVLTDCQLPEMDGYEGSRLNRDGSTTVRNRHAMVDDRARCLAAGMNDYITKPVRPKVLKEVLE